MNKTIEKYIYIAIELLITAAFIVFLYFNFNQRIEFFCPIMQKVYTTKLVYISFLLFIFAQIAGFSLCSFFKTNVEALCNAYQKRHDNISVKNDEDKAKIEVLQAKIQTLEAALEQALNNK